MLKLIMDYSGPASGVDRECYGGVWGSRPVGNDSTIVVRTCPCGHPSVLLSMLLRPMRLLFIIHEVHLKEGQYASNYSVFARLLF